MTCIIRIWCLHHYKRSNGQTPVPPEAAEGVAPAAAVGGDEAGVAFASPPATTAPRFARGAVVALFFGASWCPQSQIFVGKLKDLYEKLNGTTTAAGGGGDDAAATRPFEVIFVSLDESEGDMVEHFVSAHGDWLTLPFGDHAAAERLKGGALEVHTSHDVSRQDSRRLTAMSNAQGQRA